MISKKMQDAINEQIKHEFYSAYLYLSMSAYFETRNLPGFASWMRVQAQEAADLAPDGIQVPERAELHGHGGIAHPAAFDAEEVPDARERQPLDPLKFHWPNRILSKNQRILALIYKPSWHCVQLNAFCRRCLYDSAGPTSVSAAGRSHRIVPTRS